MNLSEIVVPFPDGFGETSEELVLRCPLDEWPAFVIKIDALGRAHEPGETATGGEPEIVEASRVEQGVIRVGLLVYELLGGKPGAVTPLPNASEDENRVLRRCLTPSQSFATAVEFYETFSALLAGRPSAQATLASVRLLAAERAEPARSASLPTAREVPANDRTVSGTEDRKKRLYRWIPLLLALIICGGLGWWVVSRTLTPPSPPPIAKATPTPTAKPGPVNHAPLLAGEAWANRLDMKVVPVRQIHFVLLQTPVREFVALLSDYRD